MNRSFLEQLSNLRNFFLPEKTNQFSQWQLIGTNRVRGTLYFHKSRGSTFFVSALWGSPRLFTSAFLTASGLGSLAFTEEN